MRALNIFLSCLIGFILPPFALADNQGPIYPGECREGVMPINGEFDYYYFDGEEGETVLISVGKSSGNAYTRCVCFYDPDGNELLR